MTAPGGLTEQDDMENWNDASAASKGVIARRYPYHDEMGVGLEYPDDDISCRDRWPSASPSTISEGCTRTGPSSCGLGVEMRSSRGEGLFVTISQGQTGCIVIGAAKLLDNRLYNGLNVIV